MTLSRTVASGAHASTSETPVIPAIVKTGRLGPPAPSTPAIAADQANDADLRELRDLLDYVAHSNIARATGGLSPAALAEAFADWAIHLAISPGKQFELTVKGARKWARLMRMASNAAINALECAPCIDPLPQDRRFAGEEWRQWPYSFLYQAFLLQQQWWHNATTGIDGVTQQHENVVEFASRQILDMASPSNFLATNPAVLRKIRETGGRNLVEGFNNFLDDWERGVRGKPPAGAEAFQVGRNIAITPGKVVYRNRLIELIQYIPTTETVHPEPVLIVPAWIMKYYILDLSPANSLVRYLTGQGFTVFMISWKNPSAEDRDLGMEDYRRLGVMASLDAIGSITPDQQAHAVGYCLGGTLLTIAASTMARDADDRLKTVTLLAAQADFREAGELALFINESQVHFMEDLMRSQGYLDARQMAGAFQLLRSNDLIWSRIVRRYLMGGEAPVNDLAAWNFDTTRMPYRMQSQYLHQLFLDNDLAEGRFMVEGRPIAVSDIRAPIFAVGTERDHVAPWRSAFKINLLTDTDVTFLLASGGHNAGIVAGPENARAGFQMLFKAADDRYLDPDTWIKQAPRKAGSWWPAWAEWLAAHSGSPTSPPSLGKPGAQDALGDAPGAYVLMH